MLLVAFKPRPLIDLPNSIKLPDVPINMSSERTIVATNHSTAVGSFSFITTDFCSVCPNKLVLNPGEKNFIRVKLKTKRQGVEESTIILKYEDDVRLQIKVNCNAVPSTIVLDKELISFQDTFVGLHRQVSLRIDYHSIGVGTYQWKLYKDEETERKRKLYLKEVFEEVRDVETMRSVYLTQMNIIDKEGHSTVYKRIFSDEVAEVEENEEFLFQNPVFDIIPKVAIKLLKTKELLDFFFRKVKWE